VSIYSLEKYRDRDSESVCSKRDPVVITGIGLITSVGYNRESVWRAVRDGRTSVRTLFGIHGIPDGEMIGATVDIPTVKGQLKATPLCEVAVAEAFDDAGLDFGSIDHQRFGCSIAGHMGDVHWVEQHCGVAELNDPTRFPWWQQFLPNTTCSLIANKYRLGGPRLSHSTACATSLISFLTAVRSIEDGQCDIVIAAGADAIDPLFAAGFKRMRVLAESDDPATACRPFDRNRTGFVLGEGAGALVVERMSHAKARRAPVYAEVVGSAMLAEAHHVTDLNQESEALSYLIERTLHRADLTARDVGYINAHGTGTAQNDLVEMRAIRRVFAPALDHICVSSTKSMIGHTVNAAGCVELAVTTLAMRDRFAPPTINVTDPDPQCTFDCLPLVGRKVDFEHALKISVAFGGHLVAVALRRGERVAAQTRCDPISEAA
jgi:3-oxoacyl-(acyl-carrier-protein) synthase